MIANILIFLKWKTAYQVSQEIHNSKSNYSGVIKLASISDSPVFSLSNHNRSTTILDRRKKKLNI